MTTTTTTTITARDLRERLAAAGADEETMDAVLRLTAPARHRARMIDTLRAALSQATDPGVDELVQAVMAGEPVQDDDDAEESLGVAWALITLDLGGRGGRAGVEGADPYGGAASTDRMPWARGLGKGRWFASDGGAYRAAAREARYMIERALGGQPALEAIAEPYPALVVRLGERDIARLPVEHMGCLRDDDAAAWVYAHAVRQLATAAAADDDDDAMHNWAVVANMTRPARVSGSPH